MRWSVEEIDGNEEWREGEWKRKRKKRNLLEGWLSCMGYDFYWRGSCCFSYQLRGGKKEEERAQLRSFLYLLLHFFLGLSWWRHNDQLPPIGVGWHRKSVKNELAVLQRP